MTKRHKTTLQSVLRTSTKKHILQRQKGTDKNSKRERKTKGRQLILYGYTQKEER